MSANSLANALIGYAPLVDHKRNALATRVRIRPTGARASSFDQMYRESLVGVSGGFAGIEWSASRGCR